MSVEYDFWKKPTRKGEENSGEMYPRVVSKGVVRLDQMTQVIHHSSTLQVAEVEAVLNSLIGELIRNLKDGYTVELGKLGYFSLKIQSRPVTDKKTIHAQSVSFRTIGYKPGSWLKKQFKTTRFKRASDGFLSSYPLSPEQRKMLLDQYLDKHPFITRTEYTQLTGRLKTAALKDLHTLAEQGYLKKHGKGNNLIFTKKMDEATGKGEK